MKPTEKRFTVTFTTKGQVVIPLWLRKEFGIQEGTKAAVMATSEGILVKPITRAYIRSLRGSLKGKGVLRALSEDRRQGRER